MYETKLNWDDLRLFLAVARMGGLAAASKATGKSPPTLGRRMLALERNIGQELFIRLSRGYKLTPKGEEFLQKIAGIEAELNPIINTTGRRKKLLVKISAGTWMSQVLCSRAQAICGPENKILLRFISADHQLDITHREAVIGIRNQRPEQIGLACRKVGLVEFAGYATDQTVKAWVQVVGNTPSALWLAAHADAEKTIEVTTPNNALDIALSGAGRAILPTFVGDSYPELHRVTATISNLAHEQWLVTHNEERFTPPIRKTIDRLYSVLQQFHAKQGRLVPEP